MTNLYSSGEPLRAGDILNPPGLPSEFGERFLEWDGEPLSFDKYPFMRQPLNDGASRRLYVWARQVGKTLSMGVDVLAVTSLLPRTSVVFISSAVDNAKVFHNQKLKPLMDSPKWRAEYYEEGGEDAIFYKRLKNGSDISLRGGQGGGRIRGITAGNLYLDELQDIDRDVVEAAESVMTRAKVQRQMMGGTQSNLESSVNHYWDNSDRKEWMWLCSHCDRWSDEIGHRNIGRKGLICAACGGQYNLLVDRGQWVRTGARSSSISAYRFPLISLPGHNWHDILHKLENKSPMIFNIDILALPFDFSSKPISTSELKALCDDNYTKWLTPAECRGYRCVAGVDFGHNMGSTTQIVVAKEDAYGKLKLAYCKKLVGFEADPRYAKEELARVIEAYNVAVTCCDQGGQWESIPWLRDKFGAERIHAVFATGDQKAVMQFNRKDGFWTMSKVQALNQTFLELKKGRFILPAWSLFSPFGTEILNEFITYDEDSQRQRYDHPPEHPDDSLSALNLCRLAWSLLTGEYKKTPVRGIAGPMFSAG